MGEHGQDERREERDAGTDAQERERETARPGVIAPGAAGEERKPIGDDADD